MRYFTVRLEETTNGRQVATTKALLVVADPGLGGRRWRVPDRRLQVRVQARVEDGELGNSLFRLIVGVHEEHVRVHLVLRESGEHARDRQICVSRPSTPARAEEVVHVIGDAIPFVDHEGGRDMARKGDCGSEQNVGVMGFGGVNGGDEEAASACVVEVEQRIDSNTVCGSLDELEILIVLPVGGSGNDRDVEWFVDGLVTGL